MTTAAEPTAADAAPPAGETAPAADTLASLNLKAGHAAVCGLQWGDEGKGQIVDMLTDRFDVVARYNGGNNAGHSVHVGDEKFALHLLPSGVIHPGQLNVIGNGVVVDPTPETGILKEIAGLRERGVDLGENLRISARAHCVMPYHREEDRLREAAAAAPGNGDDAKSIGTTGRGIGPCYADKAHRTTAVRMCDLVDPDMLKRRLARVLPIKAAVLKALAEVSGLQPDLPDADDLLARAMSWGEALRPHVCDTRHLLADAEDAGKRVLFEGANAVLLDVDHGTYPFVTSSSTSPLGIAAGTGLPTYRLTTVLGVAKAYVSRVGGGPHPTEQDNAVGQHLREVGQEYGTTTGRPRRTGWIDLVALRYAAQLAGCTGLVMTGLSVLAGLATLRLCTGYKLDGEILRHYPADAATLERLEPVYDEMPGFAGPVDAVRGYDDLPEAAKAYVDRVESTVGVPVKLVCVGRRRDQVLVK